LWYKKYKTPSVEFTLPFSRRDTSHKLALLIH